MPDLADFLFYSFSNGIFRHEKLAFAKKTKFYAKLSVWLLGAPRSSKTMGHSPRD